MKIIQETLMIDTCPLGQGMHNISAHIESIVGKSQIETGRCDVFVQHTSCSLVIQENACPAARTDLESWIAKIAPEGDPYYQHTQEGPDDMPAHLRSAITSTSESIPISQGHLALGTWQGLYLWEHRHRGSRRRLVVTIIGA
ncbi:MAG: secondary thiamine-phosphate synthase enzyme YjbQ [Myxococcota bacterium]|nr:secondary thiamine-phosphate synthase enzyme YjbQ [Myxococcota bacterium]